MDGGQHAGERAEESARTPHTGTQRSRDFLQQPRRARGWLRRAGVVQLWMEVERKQRLGEQRVVFKILMRCWAEQRH